MAAASATAAATNADVRIRRIIISSSLGGLISRSDLRLNIGRCQSSFAVAVVMPALVRSPARPGQDRRWTPYATYACATLPPLSRAVIQLSQDHDAAAAMDTAAAASLARGLLSPLTAP